MTDAFTAADPHHRRAQVLAAKHLPLQAGEVAEFRRRRLSIAVIAVQLIACCVPVLLLMALIRAVS